MDGAVARAASRCSHPGRCLRPVGRHFRLHRRLGRCAPRAGIPAAACEFLRSPQARPPPRSLRGSKGSRHHLVPFTDGRYPVSLRELARGPIALYVEGRADVLNDPQLSIVGSRNPTPSGRDIAFEFAESLAACGLEHHQRPRAGHRQRRAPRRARGAGNHARRAGQRRRCHLPPQQSRAERGNPRSRRLDQRISARHRRRAARTSRSEIASSPP